VKWAYLLLTAVIVGLLAFATFCVIGAFQSLHVH
jgi:hypothetical protein